LPITVLMKVILTGEETMTPPQAPQPRHVRYSVRYQARLDAETHAKLEELAAAFHRKRSAILRHAMPWGLTQTRGWTVDRAVPGTVRPVGMLLAPELLQQVQEAAATHGATGAAWVRQMLREVRIDDFPESWRADQIDVRSHDSQTYRQRFMLRLGERTSQKLQHLVEQLGMSRAEIIRQLVRQAKPEDFPEHWQLGAEENRVRRAGTPRPL
jgi:predicted transcriptional regulator